MDEVIELYKKITTSDLRGKTSPIFLDLVIRLLICKSYVLMMLNQPIKSANCFNLAQEMIYLVKCGQLQIYSFHEHPDLRAETHHYPIEILEQKYLLHRGLWALQFNDPDGARRLFSKVLVTGEIYDPRIRRQALLNLRKLLQD